MKACPSFIITQWLITIHQWELSWFIVCSVSQFSFYRRLCLSSLWTYHTILTDNHSICQPSLNHYTADDYQPTFSQLLVKYHSQQCQFSISWVLDGLSKPICMSVKCQSSDSWHIGQYAIDMWLILDQYSTNTQLTVSSYISQCINWVLVDTSVHSISGHYLTVISMNPNYLP